MRKIAAAKIAASTVGGALAAMAVAVGPAQANETPLDPSTTVEYTAASQSTCESPMMVQPYEAIGDARMYVLAPNGDFTEGVTPGWQLRNGAHLVDDDARGMGLSLPAGASAISPAMCVDLDYPHLRFAHKVVGKKASGIELKTEVVYPQVISPFWTETKQFDGYQGDAVGSGWRISPDVDIKPDLGGELPGARYAALRFTAVKKSSSNAEARIDDVYIDPRLRR